MFFVKLLSGFSIFRHNFANISYFFCLQTKKLSLSIKKEYLKISLTGKLYTFPRPIRCSFVFISEHLQYL